MDDPVQNPVLRCKMRVREVTRSMRADNTIDYELVSLGAVSGPDGTDNAKWAKYTPSADFKIQINNPAAFGTLSKGHEFFVDFTPARPDAEP
jgi:hypothetical protein